jgi:hypothetical protein
MGSALLLPAELWTTMDVQSSWVDASEIGIFVIATSDVADGAERDHHGERRLP